MTPASGGWLRAAGLAAITGSRTMLGPALAARGRAPRWLRVFAYLAAAVELAGDKLPRVPDRTSALPLAMRGVSGALVARRLVRPRGRAASGAALALGAAVAGASAFTGLRLRRALTRRLGGGASAGALAGALEDAALLVVGSRIAGPASAR
jgi:hypothetical protein